MPRKGGGAFREWGTRAELKFSSKTLFQKEKSIVCECSDFEGTAHAADLRPSVGDSPKDELLSIRQQATLR